MENDVEKHAQQSTDDRPEREQLKSAENKCESDKHLDSNTKMATGVEMIVDFDGKDDPYRPMNWPFRKKVITTILYGFTTSWITFASAIYSAGVQQIAHDFDVSMQVSATGISMVMFGFGLGPLVWAPLSEMYGRKVATLAVSGPSSPVLLGSQSSALAAFEVPRQITVHLSPPCGPFSL